MILHGVCYGRRGAGGVRIRLVVRTRIRFRSVGPGARLQLALGRTRPRCYTRVRYLGAQRTLASAGDRGRGCLLVRLAVAVGVRHGARSAERPRGRVRQGGCRSACVQFCDVFIGRCDGGALWNGRQRRHCSSASTY